MNSSRNLPLALLCCLAFVSACDARSGPAQMPGDALDTGTSLSPDRGTPPVSKDASFVDRVDPSNDLPSTPRDAGGSHPLSDVQIPTACEPIELGSTLGSPIARGHTQGRSTQHFTRNCGVEPGATGGGVDAPEAVYRWTAPETGVFTFDTTGSEFDTLLYLRRESCEGVELSCNDDLSTTPHNALSRISIRLNAGDVVVIFVDGFGSASGGFDLNISRGMSALDAGAVSFDSGPRDVPVIRDIPSTCSATDLGSRIGQGVVVGNTRGMPARLFVGGCGAAPGTTTGGGTAPEAIYTWTAPFSGIFTLSTAGSDFDTLLYLRRGACDGLDLQCNDDDPAGGGLVSSRLQRFFSAGESVFIVIDGYNGASGAYRLSITEGPLSIDAGAPVCPTGQTLCGGRCVATASDPVNCGACGVACASGRRCNAGRCESSNPRWTIFVYGHADHNLSPSLLTDIEEMSRASLGSSVNVVVYSDWDGGKGMNSRVRSRWNALMPIPLSSGNAFPYQAHWLRINGGNLPPTLLSTEPERNFDDPSILSEAVRSAFTRYPADRYAVILWDHGGSWEGGFGGDSQNGTVTNSSQRPMSASAVASAVRQGLSAAGISGIRPLEFIAFDTCLLGAAETAYPFRDIARVFIAEAEIDFGRGWDYQAALNIIGSNSAIGVEDFARAEMQTWARHHVGVPGSSDALVRSRVALDLSRMDPFAQQARSLVTSLLTDPLMTSPAIARAAMRSTPTYSPSLQPRVGSDSYRDLGQFLDAVLASPVSTSTRLAASALSSSLDSMVLARDQGSLRSLARQRGLQVALPEWLQFSGALENTYRSGASDWASATRWSELIPAMQPGAIARPTITPTWSNTRGAHNAARPSVYFETSGAVNRARISAYQHDSAAPNPGYPWRLIGVLATGSIDPGLGYRYVWDGMRVELPDGQPVTRVPFVASSNVGMMSEFQLEAAVGVCTAPGWAPFACGLVWDTINFTATAVIDVTDASRPSFISLLDFGADGSASFIPLRYYEANNQSPTTFPGTPYAIPLSGQVVLRRSRSPAGYFEFWIRVRDVYGREVDHMQAVDTAAPYGP
jgi:hypothetical protein